MGKIDWDGRVTPYPAPAAERYRQAGARGTRPIAAEFRAVAARFPDRDAIVAPDGRLAVLRLPGRRRAGAGADRDPSPPGRSRGSQVQVARAAEWVPELPKTPVGKLDKKLLQREIAAMVAAERGPRS